MWKHNHFADDVAADIRHSVADGNGVLYDTESSFEHSVEIPKTQFACAPSGNCRLLSAPMRLCRGSAANQSFRTAHANWGFGVSLVI